MYQYTYRQLEKRHKAKLRRLMVIGLLVGFVVGYVLMEFAR